VLLNALHLVYHKVKLLSGIHLFGICTPVLKKLLYRKLYVPYFIFNKIGILFFKNKSLEFFKQKIDFIVKKVYCKLTHIWNLNLVYWKMKWEILWFLNLETYFHYWFLRSNSINSWNKFWLEFNFKNKNSIISHKF